MQSPSFVYVKTVFFVSFPKATATAPTKIAIVKMVKIEEIGVSAATKYPTSKGPRTPPILPILQLTQPLYRELMLDTVQVCTHKVPPMPPG